MIQERFLRQYYNAFRYDNLIKVKNYPKATKSNLISIYEYLIENNTKYIFDDLIEKSEIYKIFTDPQHNADESNNQYIESLTDLTYIGAAPAYTFLLYLITNYGQDKQLIKGSIEFLVKYFVRRNVTDNPPTRNLDDIFIGLINKCESNKSNLSLDIIINYLTKEQPFSSSDVFKEQLEGGIYEDNYTIA
jgi:hypothetical protein